MTTEIKTLHTFGDITTLDEYELIADRFQEGFEAFVQDKLMEATKDVISQEWGHPAFAANEDFMQSVIDRIDRSALLEKRFVFVSLNPAYLAHLN